MIAYILLGLGAYLIYDDYREAKAKKLLEKGDDNATISENGVSGSSGNRNRKPGAAGQKIDRKRSIGIPVKKKGVNENELFQKSIQHDKLDTPGDSAGNDSGGKPDSASSGNQTKGVIEKQGEKENAGVQSDIKNGTGDDGDDVDG